VHFRDEREGDAGAVRAVHVACFPTDAEARIVDALRAAGDLTLSLVAEDGIGVVGHAAWSPVSAGEARDGVGLGPVAVLESHRRRGVAAELIERGLARSAELGFRFAVVLGDPKYYRRFGFEPARAHGLEDEYGGGEAFQVVPLAADGIPKGAGLVRYAPAFAHG
jgi:putative acetyltransferase